MTTERQMMQCSPTNVYSLENRRKEKDVIGWLMEIGQKYNIDEIISVRTIDISVAQWVWLRCKYGCNNYGTNWCCPPETPTHEQTKAILDEYKSALLLFGSLKNTQFYKNNKQKRRIQVNTWKGTVALERQLFLAGYYKAFGLVSECCALCKECSYPGYCKFPMDRRPSVESCSIDIFQTLKNIERQHTLAHDVGEVYHCYSIILLE